MELRREKLSDEMGSDANRDLVGPHDSPFRWLRSEIGAALQPAAAKIETENALHPDGSGL